MRTVDRSGPMPAVPGPVPRALAHPHKRGGYQRAGCSRAPRAFFPSLVGAGEGGMKGSDVPWRSHFWILDLFTEEPCGCVLSDRGKMVSPPLENTWNSFYGRYVKSMKTYLTDRVEPNAIHVKLGVEIKPFIRPNEASEKLPETQTCEPVNSHRTPKLMRWMVHS